ncbi:MAG: hypothetical protein ACREFK_02175 [Stellaceae bacterium]
MPNIRHADKGVTVDTLRREPARIFFPSELAAGGIVHCYDTLTRAVAAKRLPPPYRIGRRIGWEGRALLRMIGASPTVPEISDLELPPAA